MGERGLTYKQQRFAELVAGGCSKVEAFRRAYPSDRRGKATESEGAKRVAHIPKVMAEIQRLILLRSPHDVVAQSEHIAARLLELTKNPESEIALRAIAQWAKLAESGLLRSRPIEGRTGIESPPSPDERRQLIDHLRALYQKVLSKPRDASEPFRRTITELSEPHDLVVDGEMCDTTTNASSLAATANLEACEEASIGDLIERLEPVEEFILAAVPGRFPPRLRRIQRD
jgi:hypothetical protein